MSFWSRWFGGGFKDDKLTSIVELTLREDPLLVDHTQLSYAVEDGVITLRGRVAKNLEKEHLGSAVQSALHNSGLKYEKIVNEIQVK